MSVVFYGHSNLTPAHPWDGDWDSLDEDTHLHCPNGRGYTTETHPSAGLDPELVYRYQEMHSTGDWSSALTQRRVGSLAEWYRVHSPEELWLITSLGDQQVPYGPEAVRLLRTSLQNHRDELLDVLLTSLPEVSTSTSSGFLDGLIEVLVVAGDNGALVVG